MQNLTPNNSWVSTPRGVSDGDLDDAAHTNPAFQDAADRSEFLYGLRVQRLATRSAISALSSPSAGMAALAADGGLYFYAAAGGLTVDGVLVLTSTGSGQWVHASYFVGGIANGVATLDGSTRIVQLTKNAIVGIGSASFANGAASPPSSGSSSYVDVTGSSIVLTGLQVGDVIRVRGAYGHTSSGGSGGYGRVAFVDGGSTFGGGLVTSDGLQPIQETHVVSNAGSVTVKLQFFSAGSGGTVQITQFGIEAEAVRP